MNSMETLVIMISCGLALFACGDDSAADGAGGSSGTGGGATTSTSSSTSGAGGDAQTPPQGAANVEAWVADGAYLDWACEAEVHASRSPSPHGFNRVCSNDAIAAAAGATGDWPQGAAAVKELYDAIDATEPSGIAVYIKTSDDSAEGAGWYWYDRVGDSVVADGLGDAGPARSICVGCHVGAGVDAQRTPTPGARDFVFTPVP